MTRDTVATVPVIPMVTITPPPAPPPSPFLLSPPSQLKQLTAHHKPADNPLSSQQAQRVATCQDKSDNDRGLQSKRKRVRFKLESDSSFHDATDALEAFGKHVNETAAGSYGFVARRSGLGDCCHLDKVRVDLSDTGEGHSDIVADDATPSPGSEDRSALSKLRKLIGRFSKVKLSVDKPRLSGSQQGRSVMVNCLSRSADDRALSSQVSTGLDSEVQRNTVIISQKRPRVSFKAGDKEEEDLTENVASADPSIAMNSNDQPSPLSEGRYGSASFSTFNVHPCPSELKGRSEQYTRSLFNLQLYRLAARQHHHVQENLHKQSSFAPVIEVFSEPIGGLENDNTYQHCHNPEQRVEPNSIWCAFAKSCEDRSGSETGFGTLVSDGNVTHRSSRYGELSFKTLSPRNGLSVFRAPPPRTTVIHLPHITVSEAEPADPSLLKSNHSEMPLQIVTRVSNCTLNGIEISGRSIQLGSHHGQGEDSSQLTSGVMVSNGLDTGSLDRGVKSWTGFSKMDAATLAKLGWSDKALTWQNGRSQRYGTAAPKNASSVTLRPSSEVPTTKYRLSKLEFRRLTEQVRDVDNIIKNKFRKPVSEKLYRLTAVTTPDAATQALRDELQASRLPFQPRTWRPLTPENLPEPSVVRCRPVGSRPTTAQGPRSTLSPPPCSAGPQRPRSTPVHGIRTPHSPALPQGGFSPHPPSARRPDTPRVEHGNFDTLSPRILSLLVNDAHPRPTSASYGDRILTAPLKRRKAAREKKDPAQAGLFSDDVSTTSGIDSDGGDDVTEDDDDNNNRASDGGDDDDDEDENDDSSDSENGGFEPSLEDIRRQLPHPQNVFRLRPEKLDAIYVPEDKRDMRRFDFDAEKVDLPPYDFKCPLPDSLAKVSLRLCAREGSDWRDFLPPSAAPLPEAAGGPMKAMMDRLVELERCQIVTEDWENKKLRGQIRRQERLALNGAGGNGSAGSRPGTGFSRGGGGGGGPLRDKRCCGLCLQAACVGDCPEKRQAPGRCEKCRQPLCTGACQDSRYDQRMRHARSSDSLILDEKPPPPPPRSPSRGCHSCLRRHNAKLINANSLLLGRPKSSLATYSRGKSSSRPNRDLRPSSAMDMNFTLLKDFERLGIEPQQPTPPPAKPARPLSRNGMLPGKSSRSNRKNSITDVSFKKKKIRQVRSAKGFPRSAS